MQLTTLATVGALAASAQAAPNWGWGSPSQWTSAVPKSIAPWLPNCVPAVCTQSIPLPGLPQWGSGDQSLCSQWWAQWTPFCQSGNPPCQAPPSNPPGNPCNPPSTTCKDKYQLTQQGYTITPTSGVYAGKANTGAAAQDNDAYMTYVLVQNDSECIQKCEQTKGCQFVNVYQAQYPPNELPKDLSPSAAAQYKKGNLTCALFKSCLANSAFTNVCGQNDPCYITQSNGYCKSQACQTSGGSSGSGSSGSGWSWSLPSWGSSWNISW